MIRHQLCGVVVGPTLQKAFQQIDAFGTKIDLIEICADRFADLSLDQMKKVRSYAKLPTIFSLRSQNQGGRFSGSTEKQEKWILLFASLFPAFLDIESRLLPTLTDHLRRQYPEIGIISSYHNPTQTPNDIDSIFEMMRKHPAAMYKIVTHANNCLDGMRILRFVKKCEGACIGFCMGEEGAFTRPIAPLLGSPITYASPSLEDSSAPGQFSLSELIDRFRINEVSNSTYILGLIGDPIHRSLSKETHHKLIKEFDMDAIYVQIRVQSEELPSFLKQAEQLGIKGLSVTMPHKETVAKLVNANEPAVNTLLLTSKGYIGRNYDGEGAIRVVEKRRTVHSSHIVILGAGGAALGIATEALLKGAKVTLVNRTPSRAEKASKCLGCSWGSLAQFPEIAKKGFDFLINTIPIYDQCPIPPETIIPGAIYFEIITNPKETAFLKAAREKGNIVIPGIEMFMEQAKKQFAWWVNACKA